VVHPIAVAAKVREVLTAEGEVPHIIEAVCSAAVVHDVLEDTDYIEKEMRAEFGANYGFVFTRFQLNGGGYWTKQGRGGQAGACFRIRCLGGDEMAYYKPTLQDIYASYAEYGFVFEGAVFEFSHINLHAENMSKDGILAQSFKKPDGNYAVMSNAFGIAPNMSRNLGAGIRTAYSHNIIMGSFILNGQGGVVAPQGLRVGAFNNGENTGEALFDIGGNGYGTVLLANEASSNTETIARQFEGSQWVTYGVPMQYVMKLPAGDDGQGGEGKVTQHDNHIATYWPGNLPVRVVK
jgi:hypothetical protein